MTDYTRFLSSTGRQLAESAIRRMGTVVAGATDIVSFAPGYPAPELFPWDELRDISAGLLSGAPARAYEQLRPYGFFILYALILSGMLWRIVAPAADAVQSLLL